MDAQNFLFIFSDEHRRSLTGCYGSEVIKTPNLDRLAARGAVFDNAYTPSPICVPARGALATGKWAHQGPYWDNVFAYHGECPSWHRRIREFGHRMDVTGKLHYRSDADDNGFTEELDTMHRLRGTGDLIGSIRNPSPPPRLAMPALANGAGAGECTYNHYDRKIADNAVRWIAERAGNPDPTPWAYMVSFTRPHYPLTCPPEFLSLYDPADIELPAWYRGERHARHPWIEELSQTINYGDYFRDDDHVRLAIASYYGLVSFLDAQIGRVLDALSDAGLEGSTRVLYSSDHGDNVGDRGLWGKSTMYEESCAVPMIFAGPGIDAGRRISTPTSLIDIYKTAIEAMGHDVPAEDRDLPSRSLFDFLAREEPERVVFSEYHAMGSNHASFMVRSGSWKYIYYVGHEPELFNLAVDPYETTDLAADPGSKAVRQAFDAILRSICDPEATDLRALEDQRQMLDGYGGVAAVLARGDLLYTPTPGEEPKLKHDRTQALEAKA
ncbi:sulfatase-like hydrolase/transferase [Frigidibacter oleivorans]|uniref:sulfatase-like hydrolase/transferase n=1 Tax=Frigidibacter oleivorans TaxID=2487129 RepID=UPI000F8E2FCD|nr:sulfatase-like hydrolase/transferase [Frigidibacter oleivorans]